MQQISAVYVRMSTLLDELGEAAFGFYNEISMLRDKLSRLGIAWEGAAHDEYLRVLLEDIEFMEAWAEDIGTMYSLLRIALSRYQYTEMKVNSIIGGLRK